jgi:hypothetical protein
MNYLIKINTRTYNGEVDCQTLQDAGLLVYRCFAKNEAKGLYHTLRRDGYIKYINGNGDSIEARGYRRRQVKTVDANGFLKSFAELEEEA